MSHASFLWRSKTRKRRARPDGSSWLRRLRIKPLQDRNEEIRDEYARCVRNRSLACRAIRKKDRHSCSVAWHAFFDLFLPRLEKVLEKRRVRPLLPCLVAILRMRNNPQA